jgi:hypothetical protein
MTNFDLNVLEWIKNDSKIRGNIETWIKIYKIWHKATKLTQKYKQTDPNMTKKFIY